MSVNEAEALRQVWTPGSELEEVMLSLEPATQLDSLIRHWLHAILIKEGPKTIDMTKRLVGTMHHRTVHGPGPTFASRESSIWIEN
jgi:hypothetical protein